LSAADKNGRLARRSTVRVLGWVPGTRTDIHAQAGIITARPAADAFVPDEGPVEQFHGGRCAPTAP
jgi:hypothetical protein